MNTVVNKSNGHHGPQGVTGGRDIFFTEGGIVSERFYLSQSYTNSNMHSYYLRGNFKRIAKIVSGLWYWYWVKKDDCIIS